MRVKAGERRTSSGIKTGVSVDNSQLHFGVAVVISNKNMVLRIQI